MAEVILASIKDLIKYKIVAHVNTGDKTLDNMVNMLLIAVLSIAMSAAAWRTLYIKWYIFKMDHTNNSKTIDFRNYYYYVGILTNDDSVMYSTWDTSKDKEFTRNLSMFFMLKLGWKLGSKNAALYDMKRRKTTRSLKSAGRNGLDLLTNSVKDIMPIYIGKDGSVIGLTIDKSAVSTNVYIIHQGVDVLLEFIDHLEATAKNNVPECRCVCRCKIECQCYCECPEAGGCDEDEHYVGEEYCEGKCVCADKCGCPCGCGFRVDDDDDEKVPYKRTCKIYTSDDRESTVYPDRNFDQLVSRHKTRIVGVLDDMKKALETGVSRFNGMGSFNVGIMLHGSPGTGKTMVIKAVCNYLQRDAYVVDMKKIKTAKQFRNLFTNHEISETIFVFDEFDTVQGIIAERSLESKDADSVVKPEQSDRETLNRQYMEVLALKAVATKETVESLNTELAKIDKKLKELEEALTLETMLTVLDGVSEHRGRVIIATTNFLDRIDSALIRSGRFDLKISMDKFNSEEIRELLSMMFKGIASQDDLNYLQETPLSEDKYTPTQLIRIGQDLGNLREVVTQIKA